MKWLVLNYLELVSVVSGIVYIILSVRQSIWLWPLGIVSSAFFALVFYQSKLYADMGLNMYYVFASIYGWYFWLYGTKIDGHKQIPVSRCTFKLWLILALTAIISSLFLSYIMIRFTDSNVPYIDASLAACSLVATWMLSRKLLENWILWIVIDLLYVPLYAYKGLHLSIVLYLIFALMSFIGLGKWKKTELKNLI